MYKFIKNIDEARLDEFVQGHPNCHLLQSAAWGKVKENWKPYYAGVEEEGELVATALILVRPLVLGKTLWYIPRGPVVDYERTDLLKFFLENLVIWSREESAAVLKIDSSFERSVHRMGESELLYPIEEKPVFDIYQELNFKHKGYTMEMHDTIQPRFVATTYHEDVIDGFPKSVRRLIKDAEKHSVQITKEGREGLDDFMFVLACTEEEKDIKLRNKEYFERLFDLYEDKVQLYLARIPLKTAVQEEVDLIADLTENLETLPVNAPKRKLQLEDQIQARQKRYDFFKEKLEVDGDVAVLAGCLSVLYGNTTEILYAGMNRDYNKIAAQLPIYVETMEEAFQKGAIKASMGGISGTEDDGLSLFKSRFSPRVIEYLGEFDYIHSRFIHWGLETVFPQLVKIRKKLSRG